VFVPPAFYVSRAQERAEYDLHDNRVDDPGYRRFLSRLHAPLVRRLPTGAHGLDFGCGPGPALAAMLQEDGLPVALYDIFYAPDTSVFSRQYDFITATEVVEHLHDPAAELNRLWQCLADGGVLAIMTKLARDAEAFARWHYKNDPTHVCFFSRQTFVYLAAELKAELEFVADDVIFLTRRVGAK
jgi:2-polyprenyl-3-methyl-5-hydroxy-6-metoxy-1,4-benzoquinol methylase